MLIGSHVSFSKGLLGAAKEAHSYNANYFMLYTGAPQNTIRKPLDKLFVNEGIEFMKNNNLLGFIVHAPYIINLASPNIDTYTLAKNFLKVEIDRTEKLGSKYLVLHPGSYTSESIEYGIDRIASGLNEVIEENQNVIICLETMAGKGSEVGSKFEELKAIIDKVTYKDKIAVCFDTCHTHDSGYDIINDFDSVLNHFDSVIGLDKLICLHVNGSLNPRGAKKDRHANLGALEDNHKGVDYIGFDAISYIVHHEKLKDKIFILETPWIDEKTNLYKEEIEMLRSDKKYAK